MKTLIDRAEIALLRAEEDVRFPAAPVIALLHFRVRDQVGDLLVHIKLLGGDGAVGILEIVALKRNFAAQDAVDPPEKTIELLAARSLPDRREPRAFP